MSGALPLNALRDSAGLPPNALRDLASLAPHRVILAPNRQPTAEKQAIKHPRFHHPHYWSQYHRPVQPAPAVLPEANQRETWKTPYSYGYFGASNKRHWTAHHGYRDRYTEWRLH
jgi:hypothetical protein